jgi:uncharacterized protein (DUF2336 family)
LLDVNTLSTASGLETLKREHQLRDAEVQRLRGEMQTLHDLMEPLEIAESLGKREDAIQRLAQLLNVPREEAAEIYARRAQGVNLTPEVKLG